MNHQEVFKIRTQKEFRKRALAVFQFQAENNSVYKNYIHHLGVLPGKVTRVEEIPFLPIELFKTQEVVTQTQVQSLKSKVTSKQPNIFMSSGTGGMERSKHVVSDISVYEESFRRCFKLFYGDVKKYAILALLPSYYENKNSSLLFMVMELIKMSGNRRSAFYNSKDENLVQAIQELLKQKQKVILFGVSFALLDLTPPAQGLSPLSRGRGVRGEVIIIETGGMKGRREEITREELHKILCEKFGVKKIHSEYGMTELLSQAWSKGSGIFECPPWMKVLVRDANDPFSFLTAGKSGALNIIDLANMYSCSFIATQDVGRVHKDGTFEVLGRMDNSDLRGCNLMAQ